MAKKVEGRYLLHSTIGALLVTGVAGLVAGHAGRSDVLAAGAFAWLFQVVLFLVVSVLVLHRNRIASFVVSMLGRMVGVLVFAFLVMPALVLAPVPSLLTLVAVFMVMSVLEASIVQPQPAVSR